MRKTKGSGSGIGKGKTRVETNSFVTTVNMAVVRHESAGGDNIRWTAENCDHAVSIVSDRDDCPPLGSSVAVEVRWKAPSVGR